MFDFSYKSQYPSFSYEENSFDFKNYKLKDSIVLRKDFISKGVTILKNKNDDPEKICDEFKKLGDFFGRNQIRDATRRSSLDTKDNQTNIKTVDLGKFVGPHAETSFSPARPSVIGFVCLDIEEKKNNGLTTLIDGFNLWKDLSIKTKKYCFQAIFFIL